MSAEDRKRGAVEAALVRLDKIVPTGILTGGYRIQAREALAQLFEDGKTEGAWEPVEAPRTTSEALGRPQMARGAQRPVETVGMTLGDDLKTWWMNTAAAEAEQLVAKAVEYGGAHRAQDLIDIGRDLVAAGVANLGPGSGLGEDAWYQELGCYFYLRGKVGRWTAAIAEGRPVSDDTLHDIGIYVRMVQRIRAVGGWPV